MPQAALLLNNFTGGEWSHRMGARVDLAKYRNACRELTNFLVHPHGGASRRPGTRFVAPAGNEAARVALVPFVFSVNDAYALELGQTASGATGYIRFFTQGAQLYSGSTIYEVASPFTAYHLDSVRTIQSGDLVYMVHPEVEPQVLVRSGAANWTLKTVEFVDGPYGKAKKGLRVTPEGGTAYNAAVTLHATASLFSSNMRGVPVRWQRGSTWYWFELRTFYSVTQHGAKVKGWEDAANAIPVTGYHQGTIRLGAWGAHAGYPATLGFFEQRLLFGGAGNLHTYDADPQTIWTTVTGEYGEACLMSPGAYDDSGLEYTLDSDTQDAIQWLSGGKRLTVGTEGTEWVAAASLDSPLTPSSVRFLPESSHGAAPVPALRVAEATVYLGRHSRKLYEMVYVYADDKHKSVDLSLLAEHITEGGLGRLCWAQDPDSIIYATRSDGSLVGLTYMRNEDVVAWHKHNTAGRFESIVVIPGAGHDELWAVVQRTINGATRRYIECQTGDFGTDLTQAVFVDSSLMFEDGQAALSGDTTHGGATVYPWLSTAAWPALATGGTVRVTGLPALGWGALNGRDYALLSVATSGNTTRMQLGEYASGASLPAWAAGGSIYRHVSAVTGLSHLNGMSVQILADGSVHPVKTVSAGQITLDLSAYRVQAGLSYTSTLETMRLEPPVQGALTAQGKVKSINDLRVRFYRTVGARVQVGDWEDELVLFRDAEDPMETPIPLLDERDMRITPQCGVKTELTIKIIQDQPLPCTVLGIFPNVDIEE